MGIVEKNPYSDVENGGGKGAGAYGNGAKKGRESCFCCICRLKWYWQVLIYFLLLVLVGVIVVGSIALHVWITVWDKDGDVHINGNPFMCEEQCLTVDHSLWDKVLKGVVKPGAVKGGIPYNSVDFAALRAGGELRDAHLEYMEVLSTTQTNGLDQTEATAFLLNAYNAFAVDLIVTKNPGNSILDLTDFLKGSVFKRFKYKLLFGNETKEVALDNIEHQFMRELVTEHNEPRVHAAVNCVSVSCPDLRPEAYTGKKLNKQLEEQTKIWLQNEGKGIRVDEEKNEIWISALFSWFREDFVSRDFGGKNDLLENKEPLDWAIQFATPEVQQYVQENQPDVKSMSYNWDLITPVP